MKELRWVCHQCRRSLERKASLVTEKERLFCADCWKEADTETVRKNSFLEDYSSLWTDLGGEG